MIKTSKKYIITSIILLIMILVVLAGLIIIIDPYFHYHKPLKGIAYTLNNQRYQNDGIVKHFEYDAIITGTSMTENFKTSELDQIFNVNSIKVPFSGGSYKEINDNLVKAIEYNNNIKMIVRCLDLYKLFDKPEKMEYSEESYPNYLYDSVLYNDTKYIFNKTILAETLSVLIDTLQKKEFTSFDDYSNWNDYFIYSNEEVRKRYVRPSKNAYTLDITEYDYKNIKANITQNVTNIAANNTNIEFYLYFPPYSIYYWDKINQDGSINRQLDAIEYATELLLEYPNIHIYSFINEYDVICDLNNYKDYEHHSEQINSEILKWIKSGKNQLTKENYKKYLQNAREFYIYYDYDKLFE